MKLRFVETIEERSRRVDEIFANYEPIRDGGWEVHFLDPPQIIWTVQGTVAH